MGHTFPIKLPSENQLKDNGKGFSARRDVTDGLTVERGMFENGRQLAVILGTQLVALL